MFSLPFVSAEGYAEVRGTLVEGLSEAEFEALDKARLRLLGREWRVFSELEGDEEFQRYEDASTVTAKVWRERLARVPTTTTQVLIAIVRPTTKRRCGAAGAAAAAAGGCSYAAMMQRRGGAEAAKVGPANVFLSHAWRYNYKDQLMAAVFDRFGLKESVDPDTGLPSAWRRLNDRDDEEVFLWNDIFVEDQSVPSKPRPEGYFYTAFKDAIREIGFTLIVATPFQDPIPFKRSWCIWEIFCTVTAGIPFEVVGVPAEKEEVRRVCRKQGGSAKLFTQWLNAIDVDNARAFHLSDQEAIAAAVATVKPDGAETVKFEILDAMDKFFTAKWCVAEDDETE